MPVKRVPTMGWTKGDVAATIRLVTQEQRNDIAARVRAEMERQNLSSVRLARKAEVSDKTISRLINAQRDPRYDTLERVAKALGLKEKDLRGDPPAPLGLGASNGHVDQEDMAAQLADIDRRLAAIEDQLSQLLGAASIDGGSQGDLADRIVKTVERAINQRATEVARPPRRPAPAPTRRRRQDAA